MGGTTLSAAVTVISLFVVVTYLLFRSGVYFYVLEFVISGTSFVLI